MNTRHAFDPPPPGCFCLAVNMIAGGKFLNAGQPMPLAQLSEIPANLRKEKYIIRHSNAEPEPEVVTNFQMNTVYGVDQDDRLRRRHVERQATEQAAAADFQDAIEAQLADEIENPDETVASALALAAEDHQASVGLQRAQAEAAARRREMDEEAARQFIAEQDAMLVDDDSVVPAEEQIPVAPGPRKMRKRFVNRKGTWLRAQKLKHRIPGEDVFVRESKGQFLKIGVVDQAGRLPVCYLEESNDV